MGGSVTETLGKLMFRGMDMMRHRSAFDVGAATPQGKDFTRFDKTRQILLVTFKRSGEAMPSPINHGVADGKIYVRTDASTGKVKRINNNPRVSWWCPAVFAASQKGKRSPERPGSCPSPNTPTRTR